MNITHLTLPQIENLTLTQIENLVLNGSDRIPLSDLESRKLGVPSFDDFVLSARGLLGRVYLPNNAVALQADISEIYFEVYEVDSGDIVEEGYLDVDEVMPTSLTSWGKDSAGYNFLWPMSGEYFTSAINYRIVLSFFPVSLPTFVRVYRSNRKNPITI